MRKRGKNEKREKNLFYEKKREYPRQTLGFSRGWEPSFPEGPILPTLSSALVERTLTTHWPKNEAIHLFIITPIGIKILGN
jgi:hypothetical protein